MIVSGFGVVFHGWGRVPRGTIRITSEKENIGACRREIRGSQLELDHVQQFSRRHDVRALQTFCLSGYGEMSRKAKGVFVTWTWMIWSVGQRRMADFAA